MEYSKDFKLERVKSSDIEDINTEYVELINEDAIANSVFNILDTKQGSVFFKPLFGCNLHYYLHEKPSILGITSIQDEIVNAIRNFESRVQLTGVNVSILNGNEYVVRLQYINRQNNTQNLMTFNLETVA